MESMREEVATAAIHGGFTQQMRGDRISHRESPKGRWKHRDGGLEGLTVHEHTGCCSLQHSPHTRTLTPHDKHTHTRRHCGCSRSDEGRTVMNRTPSELGKGVRHRAASRRQPAAPIWTSSRRFFRSAINEAPPGVSGCPSVF